MKTTVKERFTKANIILLVIGSLLPLAALGLMIIREDCAWKYIDRKVINE